jgi:hypothetical protein
MRATTLAALALAILATGGAPASAEDFSGWKRLEPRFPSTGGGGVMIGEYRPVVRGSTCTTDFTATEPDGTVHRNTVVFDAVPTAGGILCTNGRWRSLDNDAAGTTPFRVFFRDGVAYASQ